MQERHRTADWSVAFPSRCSADGTWQLLQSMLIVNWSWDIFIWNLRELWRLLTTTPAEFNYLFLTAFVRARAAYLAATGPFDCEQQAILLAIGEKRVQFVSIYYRLLVGLLRDVLGSESGAKVIGDREERLFQLAIAEMERRYIEILEVIALIPEADEEIHGLGTEAWVKGVEGKDGHWVSVTPPAVYVPAITQPWGRHRIVRPCARDLVQKIKSREPMRSYMERVGMVTRADIAFEKLSRFRKVSGYPVVKYGDLEVQYYLTLTNAEKRTLYVVCANQTMRIHQWNGVAPACAPVSVEAVDKVNGKEDLYLVAFDNGEVGLFAIDFRPQKENEHEHVPGEVLNWAGTRGNVAQGNGLKGHKGGRTVGGAEDQRRETTDHRPETGELRADVSADAAGVQGKACDVAPAFAEGQTTADRQGKLRVSVTVDAEGLGGSSGPRDGAAERGLRQQEMAALREHLDKRLDGVGQKVADVEKENSDLKGHVASVLAGIAKRVDPEYFYWVFTVVGAGSVSKAAKLLGMANSSLDARLSEYRARGGMYETLWGVVESRRRLGVKSIARFDETFGEHQVADVRDEGIMRDLLDGLEALNAKNWAGVRKELIELIETTGL